MRTTTTRQDGQTGWHLTVTSDRAGSQAHRRDAGMLSADPRWRGLYRLGGAAAALSAMLAVAAMVAFLASPPPLGGSAADWFALFERNPLLGLVGLDLPFLVVWALLIPLMLAVFLALSRTSPSVLLLAAVTEIVAMAVYFASNPSFEMLALSQRYAAAGTDAERAMLLAAGEAVLASFQGTAFKISYVLASIAGVLVGSTILRSRVLSPATGTARLLASLLGLGLFLPVVGVVVGLASVLFELAWYVLAARDLFRIGRGGRHQATSEARW